MSETNKVAVDVCAKQPSCRPNVPGEVADNWQHRSKKMRCGTCMWFIGKTTTAIQSQDNFIGRCRRRCPTINGFPAVFSSDWCGDHKLDEEKI